MHLHLHLHLQYPLTPFDRIGLTYEHQPTIANALLPVEGNGYFSNFQLASAILLAPAILLRLLPFVSASSVSWTSYFLVAALTGVPTAIAYWTVMSIYGPRKNTKVDLPGRTYARPPFLGPSAHFTSLAGDLVVGS